MTWKEGVQYRHREKVTGARGPVEGTCVGWAGLAVLPRWKWADRENPPWTGPSDWPWWMDQKNIPEDFRDPRRDL